MAKALYHAPMPKGFTAVFGGRQGGVSKTPFHSLNIADDLGDLAQDVEANQRLFCQQAGFKTTPHHASQAHGVQILHCLGHGRKHDKKADLLICKEAGEAIAIRTADCLPILFAASDIKAVAAAHAGWRGTVKNIASEAVRALQKWGAEPENMHIVMGPCIGPCCFQVNNALAQQLQACSHAQTPISKHQEQSYADLASINLAQLQAAGVRSIQHIQACTHCQSEQFFSYRKAQGHTGRQWSAIGIDSR